MKLVKVKLKVQLTHDSIANAIKQLDTYTQTFDKKVSQFLERLAELGVEVATATVHKDTGYLSSMIHFERKNKHTYMVVSDGEYALFVEFGTGVVGEGTYKGELPSWYTYNAMLTPQAHDKQDPTKWYYYDDYGRVRSTRGQVANNYMLAASEKMKQQVVTIAKEVFND